MLRRHDPLVEVEACLPALRTLLDATRYRGIFMIEFKYDERDGLFKIIELNARPFWLIGHVERAGVDLAGSAISTRRSSSSRPPAVQGRPVRDVRDARRNGDRPGRRLSATSGWPVLKPWLFGDKALFWWSDPMPAIGGIGHSVRRRVGRGLDRVRRIPQPPAETGEPSDRGLDSLMRQISRRDPTSTRFAQV